MTDHDLDRLARKRANAKIGWYVHATVFVAVNLLLATVASVSGKPWIAFPALGWAFGLGMHGLAVFVFGRGSGLYANLVERERSKLELQRDPW
ncbi:MAG TPA: 2TM domain-containing protein [Ramlibacter sp.]|uniref:2TM domain-containing protein n=1 Tax=Ramlibacter sp. TaxID=1917967 RepID=UPI002C142AE6|nr:2TM domain-containing protein [Ramlibacter sp.]HVZ46361.1 2TM domain-containing protein [Ramlibacter sp.]